jgi:hypothetical protein
MSTTMNTTNATAPRGTATGLPPDFVAKSEHAAALAQRAMNRAASALNAAYDAGKALAEVKKFVPDRKWTEWCLQYGVDRSWSYRLTEVYNRWDEILAARASGDGSLTVTTALRVINRTSPKTSAKANQARSRASSTRRSPSTSSSDSRSGGIEPDVRELLTTIRRYLATGPSDTDDTPARLLARIDFYLDDGAARDDGRADEQEEVSDGDGEE